MRVYHTPLYNREVSRRVDTSASRRKLHLLRDNTVMEQPQGRSVVRVGLCLVVSGCALVALSSRSAAPIDRRTSLDATATEAAPNLRTALDATAFEAASLDATATEAASLDATATEAAPAAQDVACDAFDDDGTYTPSVCGAFDASACAASCTDGWCAELCGRSCSRNEGAICAARALGNISTLCATLDYADVPAATRSYDTSVGHRSMAYAEGCDHHAYCSFCGDTCANLLTQYPIGSDFISSMNFGPHAMRLLGNLSGICTARLAGPPVKPDMGSAPP